MSFRAESASGRPAQVLATDGDSRLGGDDFDRLISHWALEQCRQHGHDIGCLRLQHTVSVAAHWLCRTQADLLASLAVHCFVQVECRMRWLMYPSAQLCREEDAKGIMQQAEAAKVALSAADVATVSVPLPGGGTFDARLTLDDFEALAQPLLQRLWEPLARVGAAVFLEWADRRASADPRLWGHTCFGVLCLQGLAHS